MKNYYSKLYLILALGVAPTMAFADYTGCRNAGGSAWDCFWGAAGNDGGGSPGGVMYKQTHGSTQLKDTFDKLNKSCSRISVKEQMNCFSKGFNSKIIEEKKRMEPIEKLAPAAVQKPKKISPKTAPALKRQEGMTGGRADFQNLK